MEGYTPGWPERRRRFICDCSMATPAWWFDLYHRAVVSELYRLGWGERERWLTSSCSIDTPAPGSMHTMQTSYLNCTGSVGERRPRVPAVDAWFYRLRRWEYSYYGKAKRAPTARLLGRELGLILRRSRCWLVRQRLMWCDWERDEGSLSEICF